MLEKNSVPACYDGTERSYLTHSATLRVPEPDVYAFGFNPPPLGRSIIDHAVTRAKESYTHHHPRDAPMRAEALFLPFPA